MERLNFWSDFALAELSPYFTEPLIVLPTWNDVSVFPPQSNFSTIALLITALFSFISHAPLPPFLVITTNLVLPALSWFFLQCLF